MTKSALFLLILFTVTCSRARAPDARPPDSGARATASARIPDTPLASPLRQASPLHEPRATHTATLLPDGRVFIAGGFKKGPDGYSQIYSRTTEIYAPSSRAFTVAAKMLGERAGHTATLLATGDVLLAGGFGPHGVLATAEIYSPTKDAFTTVGPMRVPRGAFTATLLDDGTVLLVGGGDGVATARTEIYDPATRSFAQGPPMLTPRLGHTATKLLNGEVLIAGGATAGGNVLASAELYDPIAHGFSAVTNMSVARYKHAAALLPDGRVLIAGGSSSDDWKGQYASVEVFDPRTRAFTKIADLNAKRFKLPSAMILLADGRVLVAGGSAVVETLDTSALRFSIAGELDAAKYYATVTPLPGGGALIAGGYDGHAQSSDEAWLFGG